MTCFFTVYQLHDIDLINLKAKTWKRTSISDINELYNSHNNFNKIDFHFGCDKIDCRSVELILTCLHVFKKNIDFDIYGRVQVKLIMNPKLILI
jgi:hypothetical protein